MKDVRIVDCILKSCIVEVRAKLKLLPPAKSPIRLLAHDGNVGAPCLWYRRVPANAYPYGM